MESSIRGWDSHRQHVRSSEIAVELAADVVPIVCRTEPRVHRGKERRDQKVQGAEVRPHIEPEKIAGVKRPMLRMIGKRRPDAEDLRSGSACECVKLYFTSPMPKIRDHHQQPGCASE